MPKKFKLKLVNGWRTWHRWWSTKFEVLSLIALSAVQVILLMPEHILYAWSIIPHDIKDTFPVEVTIGIGIFLLVASSVAKLFRERKPHEAAERDREREIQSIQRDFEGHTSKHEKSDNYAPTRGGGEE